MMKNSIYKQISMYRKIQSLAPNTQSAFAAIAKVGWAINSELDHINIKNGDSNLLVCTFQRGLDTAEQDQHRGIITELGLQTREDVDISIISTDEISGVSYKTFALPSEYADETASAEFKLAETKMNFISDKLLQASPVKAVRYSILRLIESGQSIDSVSIANFLSTSVRSIQRNLAKHGTNLKTIRDDIRRRFVIILLGSNFSPKEVQRILGFDTAASLYRNFQLWYGMTPKQLMLATEAV